MSTRMSSDPIVTRDPGDVRTIVSLTFGSGRESQLPAAFTWTYAISSELLTALQLTGQLRLVSIKQYIELLDGCSERPVLR